MTTMLRTRLTILAGALASGYIASIMLMGSPVYAQTPQHGLKTGYIATLFTGEVLPGQLDNFKSLVTRLVAAVAKEPDTLVYEISLRPDQKTYDSVEVYRNSGAVLAHAQHVRTDFGKELGQVRKTVSFVVFDSPNAEVKQALGGLSPVYESPIDGFIR